MREAVYVLSLRNISRNISAKAISDFVNSCFEEGYSLGYLDDTRDSHGGTFDYETIASAILANALTVLSQDQLWGFIPYYYNPVLKGLSLITFDMALDNPLSNHPEDQHG